MNPVLLCEKPAQARTYSECYEHKKHKDHIEIMPCETFPKGAKVVWAIGHLTELAPPERYKDEWKTWSLDTLPIIPERFQYVVSKDKVSHFKSVKKYLNDSSEIIICTDSGREGEAIGRLTISLSGCNNKPLKRFWCSSMTPEAIKKAFNNLKDAKEYESLFFEAQARAYSDWLIGINTSRAYTILMRKKGIKEVFSTGRVQTVLLSLIHQREKEIENFKPEKFWEIYGQFSANNVTYTGKLLTENQNRFKDIEVAKATVQSLNGKDAFVDSIETKEIKNRPPKLHNLSSLQAKINKIYKLSPSKVLELVQSLYENGYCSYPRSEYAYLPTDEAKQMPDVLNKLSSLDPYKDLISQSTRESIVDDKHFTNDAKVGDHFAIIATSKVPNLSQLNQEQKVVYDEIVKSTIAPFFDDHVYNQTTLITKVEECLFKSSGKQIINNGWKKVWSKENKDENEDDNQKLPVVEKDQQVILDKIRLKDGITKPPKPYTEGQLITLMKTAGKVSNFESEEISQKDLAAYGSVGTEATRAGIIDGLKARKYIVIKKNIVEVTPKGKILMVAVDKTILSSAELTAKWEMYLQQVGEGKKPAKTFIEQSKALSKKLVEDAIKSSSSWKIDNMVAQVQQQDHVGKCPNCGKGIVDKRAFYGCTGYNDGCKFTLPKEILGKKISEANVKRLLEKGKSGVIKGLKGKKNPFDAHLVIKDPKEGKLEFEFPPKKVTAKTK